MKYDETTKSLKFNESEENETGEGGYVRLHQDGVRAKDGFTFEFYGNLDRGPYQNVLHRSRDILALGIFIRTNNLLGSNNIAGQSIRVILDNSGFLGDFSNHSVWTGEGKNMSNMGSGDICCLPRDEELSFEGYYGFDIGSDVQFSIVYLPYETDVEKQNMYDEFMIEDGTVDKILYYVNGKLFGYTYYSKESFKIGLDKWDNDECNFYIGVCFTGHYQNLYYLKGNCYSLRLYTRPLNEMEVELNYSVNSKYRNSFKDEVLN